MNFQKFYIFSVQFRRLFRPTICRTYAAATSSRGALPKPPLLSQLVTEKDNAEASDWLKQFCLVEKKIPKELVEVSFSRSSGPGGQNVNKVNTKATVRCSVNDTWIPRWAHPALMKNPHYVASTHSILITSTAHRSQSQNIDECLQKLHNLIMFAASSAIKKETSAAQKKKVADFAKADNARRKADKMKRSGIKESRRGRGFDF
ncbi:RF-1 domain-containing protein [Gymnopilus junonius]|uniref:RF-1 domain-containing protein n=1 Tax=Gymnopilus junonius TaxID=109634 RepID=A0A9P5NSP8_GYMJU|nr:RF-1 domain-containing protein [Gymnopilus junonius]